MDLFKIELTEKDKWHCEKQLSTWRTISGKLMELPESTLEKLIYYEAVTRQRVGVLDRMLSRYNSLRRRNAQKNVTIFMRQYNSKFDRTGT